MASLSLLQTPPFLSGKLRGKEGNLCSIRASASHYNNEERSRQMAPPAVSFVRREVAALGLGISLLSVLTESAAEAETGAPGPFSKYIKRKKLDPLDTYVPSILLSQSQFQDLEAKLLSDMPDYGDSRLYLRAGPASSLRTNIRAVAQYASEDGNGKIASDAVDQCISSLEDLDSLLLRASRNDSSASVEKMKGKIKDTVNALDSLLATVPSEILDKCKAIVASYEESTVSPSGAAVDVDAKILESLL